MNPLAGSTGAILFAILGLVAGSFATAASHRLATDQPLAMDRSRCPDCGHTLGPTDLVPVFSWLAAKGRCAYCRAPISWRYPAIELTTTALFILAWKLGGTDLIRSALFALSFLGLVVITVADLEARIVPDKALLAMAPLAGLWRWHLGLDWIDGIAGAVLGGAAMYGLRALFKAIRGIEAMGLGDVKFIVLAGFYAGITGLAPLLVLGGLIGIVFGVIWRLTGRGATFPFGPALCIALAIMLVTPDTFVRFPTV